MKHFYRGLPVYWRLRTWPALKDLALFAVQALVVIGLLVQMLYSAGFVVIAVLGQLAQPMFHALYAIDSTVLPLLVFNVHDADSAVTVIVIGMLFIGTSVWLVDWARDVIKLGTECE